MIESTISNFQKKMGFRAKIRISAISCDSVHLCVVSGSELHQIGFPMMNPVDFMKKKSFFEFLGNSPWRASSLATASDHLQTQKYMHTRHGEHYHLGGEL